MHILCKGLYSSSGNKREMKIKALLHTFILCFSSSLSCLRMAYSSSMASSGTPSYVKYNPCSSSHARVLTTNVSTRAITKRIKKVNKLNSYHYHHHAYYLYRADFVNYTLTLTLFAVEFSNPLSFISTSFKD